MEIWKPIRGCCYEVSNEGNVRNTKNGKSLTPRPTRTGYLRVQITFFKKKKDVYVHRLVADAFCNHPEGCNVINHLDSNPANNRAENLEWTTQCENIRYAMRLGRNPNFPNFKPVVGIKDGKAFLYNSLNEAATKTGCNTQGISDCCMGKRKQHHGYTWKFAEVTV